MDWAARFITSAVRTIAEVDGIDDEEVPLVEPEEIPIRYQAPAGSTVSARPCELGVVEAAAAIRRGELTSVELLRSCLATIERTEPEVGAFVQLTDDIARTQATLADQGATTGLLHGIPFAAQDLLDTVNASARWDATVISRVRAAGGILVGKTANHESAAALGARQVPMALGTDSRASHGSTAIRPTPGLVPRKGVRVPVPSFDSVGPMTRSARDCLLLLQVMANQAPPEPAMPVVDLRRVRIGLADVSLPEQRAVSETLCDLGAQIVEIQLPPREITQATAGVLLAAEAAARLRRNVPRDAEIRSFLAAGQAVAVGDFLHAQRVRAVIRRDYADLLCRVDVILLPASPMADLPLLTTFSVPAGLVGLPAITFPCSDMQIGAQLTGPAGTEPLLAAIVDAWQRVTDWHTRNPPF